MFRFTSDRWASLVDHLQLRAANDIFGTLLDHYSESPRAYHNINHIDDCLAQFDDAPPISEHSHEVEFSIWLHDVVYDTHRADNEAKSADLAASILRDADCASEVVDRITANILATAHQTPPRRIDEQLIVDIDLSILGRTAEVFGRYEIAIRKEYAWVPWTTYAEKRTEILQSFLDRNQIYLTDSFAAKYESSARLNLEQSIRGLS